MPTIIDSKKYFADEYDINTEDKQLIDTYLPGKGTIIRISEIRKNNHPSVSNTIKELNTKVGVIYYYFIKRRNLNIYIGDNRIEGIDPLFIEEADQNSNLMRIHGTELK